MKSGTYSMVAIHHMKTILVRDEQGSGVSEVLERIGYIMRLQAARWIGPVLVHQLLGYMALSRVNWLLQRY